MRGCSYGNRQFIFARFRNRSALHARSHVLIRVRNRRSIRQFVVTAYLRLEGEGACIVYFFISIKKIDFVAFLHFLNNAIRLIHHNVVGQNDGVIVIRFLAGRREDDFHGRCYTDSKFMQFIRTVAPRKRTFYGFVVVGAMRGADRRETAAFQSQRGTIRYVAVINGQAYDGIRLVDNQFRGYDALIIVADDFQRLVMLACFRFHGISAYGKLVKLNGVSLGIRCVDDRVFERKFLARVRILVFRHDDIEGTFCNLTVLIRNEEFLFQLI